MKKAKLLFLVLALIVLTVSSCKWGNVGRYDPVIDQTVNELQQKITKFFVTAETQAGTEAFDFNNYSQFYEDLRVQSEILKVRSAAINDQSIADREIILLDENIRKLQQLHKIGIRSAEEVELLRSAFNQQLIAILKLQNGLKERRRTTSR